MVDESKAYEQALARVLEYSLARDYIGYGKFDALNSPILKTLSFNNKWLRLVNSQLIKRTPINVRPLLLVKQYKNPKGMALFARAYFNRFLVSDDQEDLEQATYCLDWLLENAAKGYSGACWGYNWDWQDLGFFAPFGMPNCVVTTFVGQAMLDGYEITGEDKYLQVCRSAIKFIQNDLKVLYDDPEMKGISYAPVDMNMVVMDVSTLAGAFMARVAKHSGESGLTDEARRLVNYVVDKQTDYHAWFYTHPPEDSPVKHDNYHTGFILDTLLDYELATGDADFREAYRWGLQFYAEELFMPNGAPKWMSDKQYPYDIHGSATGIGTFARAARFEDIKWLDQAQLIADWASTHMQKRDGAFMYQKSRYWTKRFTLMRWCNAWMAHGLSNLLLAKKQLADAN